MNFNFTSIHLELAGLNGGLGDIHHLLDHSGSVLVGLEGHIRDCVNMVHGGHCFNCELEMRDFNARS